MTLYLQWNFLLLLSFLVFLVLKKISRALAPPRVLVRWAQLLLLLSLAMPPLLRLVPNRHLPESTALVIRAPEENIFLGKMKDFSPEAAGLSSSPAIHEPEAAGFDAQAWLLFAWCAGLLFFAGRLGWQIRRLLRLLQGALTLRQLGRVRVVVSSAVTVPFSALLWRTRWVVLPEAMLLHRQDLLLALKHELQHHRQGDTRWAFALEALRVFFYPNPAAFGWMRSIHELQEFACDEALTDRKGISAREYGSCLLRVAEAALGARGRLVGTISMAAGSGNPKSFLRRRIEMITQKKHRRPWATAVFGTLMALATFSLAYGVEQGRRKDQADKVNPGEAKTDPRIQRVVEEALQAAMRKEKSERGFAIVTEPRTGRVLAVANVDTTGKRQGQWALAERIYPMSLIKPIVVAEALEKGVTTPEQKHFCENGKLRYRGRVWYDWKKEGFSELTTEDTIVKSGNICAVKIALKLGTRGLQETFTRFGFGEGGTTSSFPGARAAIVRELNDNTAPSVSYGQAFAVTPLEIVQAYGAIGNGGRLLHPQPASGGGQGKLLRQVISPENAMATRKMLQGVVQRGTGQKAASALYTTGGKTGTGYVDGRKWPDKPNIGAFIGFAPALEPKVEVMVALYYPAEAKEMEASGGNNAAPLFRQIVDAVLSEMKVAPDKN